MAVRAVSAARVQLSPSKWVWNSLNTGDAERARIRKLRFTVNFGTSNISTSRKILIFWVWRTKQKSYFIIIIVLTIVIPVSSIFSIFVYVQFPNNFIFFKFDCFTWTHSTRAIRITTCFIFKTTLKCYGSNFSLKSTDYHWNFMKLRLWRAKLAYLRPSYSFHLFNWPYVLSKY